MHLLEPKRLIQDEGFWGALRFVRNVLSDSEARQRVKAMRQVFQMYEENLAAIMFVGIKRNSEENGV